MFLSCQHPGNVVPTDHPDCQKNFWMDCVIPCPWIFQITAWAQTRLMNELSENVILLYHIYPCQHNAVSFHYRLKRPLFLSCNDNLEKRLIGLLYEKTYSFGQEILLIFMIKTIKKPNARLAHFSYHFQEATECGLSCVEIKS